jgi:hypothetical protein
VLRTWRKSVSFWRVTKDPSAAAELLKAGGDYLRRAAGWRADQSRSDPK